ncbi:MAG: cupin domain-containing protein [Desulfobacterales bacterium]|nr:cupin domain-containing protein [Desulfobacterales bacterium]
MFCKANESGYKTPVDGIRQKTLVYGDKTLLCEFRLDKGARLPRHSHPHEQSGYLVSGALRLAIGDDLFEVGPGDSWTIPGDVEHGADVIEDAVAVEVFSPVREDYLP